MIELTDLGSSKCVDSTILNSSNSKNPGDSDQLNKFFSLLLLRYDKAGKLQKISQQTQKINRHHRIRQHKRYLMIRVAKVRCRKPDREYNADEPHKGEIAKKHEKEEQPVHSVKDAPKA